MPIDLITDAHNRGRLLRFLVVGGTAYAVQWTTMKLLAPHLEENFAFTLSFLCSSGTHYTLNRFWALPSARRDSWRQLGEYLGTVALSWVVNLAVYRLCRDGFGVGKLWATAIAVPPSTVLVFLLLNFRVFRRHAAEAAPMPHREKGEGGREKEDGLRSGADVE